MTHSPFALWLAMVAMIAVALAFVLPRLVSRRRATLGASRAALNAEVYRGQLADLERERASGALGDSDYAQARSELARRLLDETNEDARHAGYRGGRRAAAAIAVLLPAAAIGLYLAVGNPASVSIEAAHLDSASDAPAFRAQLIAHLSSRPDDARGWVTLARLDLASDRFDDAASAYAKALNVSAKVARDAAIWCEYADALGMAQGGRLAGKPSELIERALAIDAAHPKALEMAGSAAYERGDFRAAARYWKQLLVQFAPDSPPHRELTAAIVRAERLAATSLPRSAVPVTLRGS